jgi:hypothetical protein
MNKVRNSIAFILKCCKVNLLVLLALTGFQSRATKDPVIITRAYISNYYEHAVGQMIEHGIPASVTLAQAIFESRCGSSALAKKSNNHFGIKCHLTWSGDTVVKTDDTLNECFRKYNTVEDSYHDHSLFLRSRSRYAGLFNIPVTDYKAWCRGLKAAGYATYPLYAEELIKIIEEHKLYVYDRSEELPARITLNVQPELKNNELSSELFEIKDFAKCDALFVNELDILMQSLDLLIETDDPAEGIAEN